MEKYSMFLLADRYSRGPRYPTKINKTACLNSIIDNKSRNISGT